MRTWLNRHPNFVVVLLGILIAIETAVLNARFDQGEWVKAAFSIVLLLVLIHWFLEWWRRT